MTQIAHLGDGSTLNQAWESALTKAVSEFKHLVASAGSKSWKLVNPGSGSNTPSTATHVKSPPSTASPAAGYPFPDVSGTKAVRRSDVVVHRRTSKTGDTYRATLELPMTYFGEKGISIDTFARAINTPEAWTQWQKLVEDASTLDLLDIHTRINSVRFRLGWPSSPRDAITIARTYEDDASLIDISTSVPRMPDEPAYLRPAPPYVRSVINLLAWCVQIQKLPTPSRAAKMRGPMHAADSPSETDVLKITCFWNWNPQGTWAVGASVPQHLPALLVGLVEFVTSDQAIIPGVAGYGRQISIHNLRYDPVRNMLNLDYAVVPETCSAVAGQSAAQSIDSGSTTVKAENQKSIVLEMSGTHSWDIQLQQRSTLGPGATSQPWIPRLSRSGYDSSSRMLHLHIDHQEPRHENDLIRIHATVERTSGNPGDVWLNGELMSFMTDELGVNDQIEPTNHLSPPQIEDSGSILGSEFSLDSSLVPDSVSFKGRSRSATLRSFSGMDVALHKQPSMMLARNQKKARGRSPAQEKSIGSLIKRNYIYFTSFLQEPDAKWRQISESRGVTVHQLNSIDPTLLVYRAEAVFVGVNLLDLWAIASNYGTRAAWSKTFEKADLLEHVNEMSELWHIHHRAGKSMAARDILFLRTTYKSPDCIHIFGLSVDDKALFPDLPAADEPHSIRQTIALQGWSLEKLSPNTVHVTLIEQADPHGWTTKTAIQQAMVTAVSGLGEFAIKSGAPPAVARLEGAQLTLSHFNLPKQILKISYQAATAWTAVSAAKKPGSLPAHLLAETPGSSTPRIEHGLEPHIVAIEEKTESIQCDIRCDSYKFWPSGIDIVVDPPPRSVTALHRHKMSESGGGLWVTVTHDKPATGSESISLTLRPRPLEEKRDRFSLFVNGVAITIDSEELPESDIQSMKKQKRTKLTRRPLDQPPALPVLRRQATSNSFGNDPAATDPALGQSSQMSPVVASTVWSRFSSPLTSIYSSAAQSSKNLFMASPLSDAQTNLTQRSPIDALGVAFEQLFRIHVDRFSETTSSDAQWQQISKGPAGIVESKILPFVSQSIPVYRSSRIIQNFSADDISSAIQSRDHRKIWDTKLMQITTLQSYGEGVTVDWMTQSMAFPLRPRGFITANMTVKGDDVGTRSPLSSTSATSNATLTFHVSTSNFDRSGLMKHADRFNPQSFGIGNVVLEGWILETLDPYSHDHYPVPSTRCMYVTAVDFGYLPLAANNLANAALPQRLSAIEKLLKNNAASLPMLKTPKDRLLVAKEMLHARQSSQRNAYTIQSLPSTSTLLQSQCSIDGSFECTLYLNGMPTQQHNRSEFPQEWYTKEITEMGESGSSTLAQETGASSSSDVEFGQSPPLRNASRMVSSTFGSLPRIRSPLSNLTMPKVNRNSTISTLIVCGLIFERSGGASFDIALDCMMLKTGNPTPIALPCDFSNGESKILQLCIEKAPAPVLRSALNENEVYSIKITDPSNRTRHPLSDQGDSGDATEGTAMPCVMRLALKRREASGDHPFLMDGRPIEVRDTLQGPMSPPPPVAWPRLNRAPDSDTKNSTCKPLACHASVLEGESDAVTSNGDSKRDETDASSTQVAADPSFRSSIPPKAPMVPPTPVRMNSIYRYLTQPVNLNRFSWPISGYPSPIVKPEVLERSDMPTGPVQDLERSEESVAAPPIGDSIVSLANTASIPRSSTALLIIFAIVLSFVLGFMSRTLVMKPEDFVFFSSGNRPEVRPDWTEFQRLLQVDAFGRHFILGVANRHA